MIFLDGSILLPAATVLSDVTLLAGATSVVRLSSGVTIFVVESLERVDLVSVVLSSVDLTGSDFVLLGVSLPRGVATFKSPFNTESLRDPFWFLASL